MKTFWVIGAGRFGNKAVADIARRFPGAAVVVVDADAKALASLTPTANLASECCDGVDFVREGLSRGRAVDWIIPVLPVHLAWAWIRRSLSGAHQRPPMAVPTAMADRLPNAVPGPGGTFYVSYADFFCPEDCPEPSDICTYTGNPRIGILYQTLQQLAWKDFLSVVVRSRQLSPGLGGYTPSDLYRALAQVKAAPGPVLVSTACKCHGVVNALGPTEADP